MPRAFPKIVSILAFSVTPIFIGFTNRVYLLFLDGHIHYLCNKTDGVLEVSVHSKLAIIQDEKN